MQKSRNGQQVIFYYGAGKNGGSRKGRKPVKGVRQNPKTGEWFLDYRLPNGTRRRETVGFSKKLAEQVMCKRRAEIAEGRFLDKRKNKSILFDDFMKEYLELHSKQNNRSWLKTDSHNLKVLKDFFGGYLLSDITPHLIEQYRQKRLQKVSPSTVNRNLSCLSCMFNKAIMWGKFDGVNPVGQVKKFKVKSQRELFLEQGEVQRLINACNGYLKAIVIIAVNTGMRRGEILSLKWVDLDLIRGIIYVMNAKNGERREVPMNEQVRQVFRLMPQGDAPNVFLKKDGTAIGDIKKSFSTALIRCGIKGFRFHDLRHTAASQLVMAGVDLNTVRELLGHKSIEMTMRYAHLSPNHKRQAVDVLSKRLDTFWTPDHPDQILESEPVPVSQQSVTV